MFDINLVPEIQQQKQSQAKRNALATIVGSVILGVVILALVILGSIKVAASVGLNNAQKDIDEVKTESEKYKELEATVLSLESGLAGVKSMIDGQNNWTLLLPHLESATPNDVRYRSLTVESSTVTARLSGKTVDSVARFLESYKNYQVMVLSGTGASQEEISFSLNGSELGKTKVKSDGSWVYAVKVATESDFVIEISGSNEDKVVYTAATKKLRSESGKVTTGISNLFSDIDTKQYAKDGDGVSFDSVFTVATGVLW